MKKILGGGRGGGSSKSYEEKLQDFLKKQVSLHSTLTKIFD